MEGRTQESRSMTNPSYIVDGNPGPYGGGTLTGTSMEPTIEDYENVFGPAARNIKEDSQRNKRHQRLHLPDALKGPNNYLADRIDGLITDATNSPFTTVILPYKYVDQPDAKMKWNVYSFDEGLASRVPYESAARVLTQTKRSFSAFMVRHGLAISMEHNFMMSPKGRENFNNQLRQLVGSIQYSNDLDVHIALVTAPSYAKTWAEKYHTSEKTPTQLCREFVDMFGFMQKNPNALEIMIEEARSVLKLWGSPPPTFLMCNNKLQFQMTMTPEKTNYVTQGIDGVKRLRAGPDIGSFRGLSIINSRSFSMEDGMPPRDLLRRRVRVAEYYRVPPQGANTNWEVTLYDESRDTWFTLSKEELNRMAALDSSSGMNRQLVPDQDMTWDDFKGGAFPNIANTVAICWPDIVNYESRLVKPDNWALDYGLPANWDIIQNQINALQGGAFARLQRHNYTTVIQLLNIPILQPNGATINAPLPATSSPSQTYAWLFSHTALTDNTLALLWHPIRSVPEEVMREHVLPFFFQDANALTAATNAWRNTRDGLNPYQTVMAVALVACMHPDPTARARCTEALRQDKINLSSLAATVVRFVRSSFNPRAGEVPTTKIELGRILDTFVLDAFRHVLIQPNGTLDASNGLWSPWPLEQNNGQPITHWAGVAPTHSSIDDPAVSDAYRGHPEYTWNNLTSFRQELSEIDNMNALGVFLTIALRRMFTDPAALQPQELFPANLPYLEVKGKRDDDWEYVIVRPCIEHNMLGVIMGKGGIDDLGATLWGQTELSCYDDSYYGTWGMSYKYHERAQVTNERNMIRLWDIAYDGYNGGKDDQPVNWAREAPGEDRPFNREATDMSKPYQGPSLMVMRFRVDKSNPDYQTSWPSPVVFHDKYLGEEAPKLCPDPDSVYIVQDERMRVFNNTMYREQYRAYAQRMPDFSYFHQVRKLPGNASVDMETSQNALAFQGTYKIRNRNTGSELMIHGSGHHGPDYVGVASLRMGKGTRLNTEAPRLTHLV